MKKCNDFKNNSFAAWEGGCLDFTVKMIFSSRCILIVVCIFALISSHVAFATQPTQSSRIVTGKYPPIYLRLGEKKIFNFTLRNLNKTELAESSATIRAVSDSDVLRAEKVISLSEINDGQWHGFRNK